MQYFPPGQQQRTKTLLILSILIIQNTAHIRSLKRQPRDMFVTALVKVKLVKNKRKRVGNSALPFFRFCATSPERLEFLCFALLAAE